MITDPVDLAIHIIVVVCSVGSLLLCISQTREVLKIMAQVEELRMKLNEYRSANKD